MPVADAPQITITGCLRARHASRRASSAKWRASVSGAGTLGGGQLAGPKACHLRAHPCAIRGVEEEQRTTAVVAARRLVLGDQSSGEVISARRDQVHHEERQVRGHVDAAQGGIELDGVKDLDRVTLEDHMLGAQIAVAVANEAARGTILELLVAGVQERDSEAVSSSELPGAERVRVGRAACRSSR